ncbi:MAG TPA: PDZ domain-containing protein, partial [Acetobacteraceae bacterium]|nr:PDZ domain-containing protein [Acetobacteraceae bacterium]
HGLFRKGGRANLTAGGVGGALATREFTGDNFTFAGLALANVPVTVSEAKSGAFVSRSLAGNLGAAVLGRFRITFDERARSLTLVPTADAHAPFRVDRSGVSLTQHGPDRIEVLAVAPGSPAATAGLRVGDAITAVNGETVAARQLGVFDVLPLLSGAKSLRLTVTRGALVVRVAIRS